MILRWRFRRAYIRLRPLRHWLRIVFRPRWGLEGALWRDAMANHRRIMNPVRLGTDPLSIFAPDPIKLQAVAFNCWMAEERARTDEKLRELREACVRLRAQEGRE